MRVEENKLILDEKLEFENAEELLNLSSECEEIIVQTNDIHPSIMQLLFSLSEDKEITVEDEFYKKFFDNLELAS
jgi:hypothetical protein